MNQIFQHVCGNKVIFAKRMQDVNGVQNINGGMRSIEWRKKMKNREPRFVIAILFYVAMAICCLFAWYMGKRYGV